MKNQWSVILFDRATQQSRLQKNFSSLEEAQEFFRYFASLVTDKALLILVHVVVVDSTEVV